MRKKKSTEWAHSCPVYLCRVPKCSCSLLHLFPSPPCNLCRDGVFNAQTCLPVCNKHSPYYLLPPQMTLFECRLSIPSPSLTPNPTSIIRIHIWPPTYVSCTQPHQRKRLFTRRKKKQLRCKHLKIALFFFLFFSPGRKVFSMTLKKMPKQIATKPLHLSQPLDQQNHSTCVNR